jgi:hypothetical protein
MTDAVNNDPSATPQRRRCSSSGWQTNTLSWNHLRISITMASALEGCVASLRGSMLNLDNTINILDDGVSDMPRLAKVLQTTRVRSKL